MELTYEEKALLQETLEQAKLARALGFEPTWEEAAKELLEKGRPADKNEELLEKGRPADKNEELRARVRVLESALTDILYAQLGGHFRNITPAGEAMLNKARALLS